MPVKTLQDRSALLPDRGGKPSRDTSSPLKSNRDMLSQLGTPRSMPDGVRSKMEQSLGGDFSGVQLYESPIVAEHGAMAAASGNKVAFAPGEMNFGSSAGLETLGHELSHVASQARGESRGSGFLKDPALERKADAEGFKAAHSALDSASGATLSPMSAGLVGISAGAPMQAKKDKEKTQGELFTEGYSNLTTPESRIESLTGMTGVSRMMGEDMDGSERTAYQTAIDGLTEDDMGALAQAMGNAYVALDTFSENKSQEETLYSPEMYQLQNVSALVDQIRKKENLHGAYRKALQANNTWEIRSAAFRVTQNDFPQIREENDDRVKRGRSLNSDVEGLSKAAQERDMNTAKNFKRPKRSFWQKIKGLFG